MAVDKDDIHAWVDGRLDGERLRAVEQVLADDPEARAEAQAWRDQAAALKQLGRDVLDEPVPERLLAAARGDGPDAVRAGADRPRNPRRHSAALTWLAAAAIAAFGWVAGWLSHDALAPPDETLMQAGPPAFVRDAVAAHVTFVPEVRHPVEVAAAQHDHLVQWLSKRLGAPLTVPSLDAAGWALVGGRLLPGTDGARAQFMYQDASGARLTLYVAEAAPGVEATAFRFDREGQLSAFYWIDGRFGYALSAQVERTALLALAEEVYRQLSAQ